MNYWVREVPAGSKPEEADHYILLGGKKSCNQITNPMEFPTWDIAQRFANSLMANPPTQRQIAVYERRFPRPAEPGQEEPKCKDCDGSGRKYVRSESGGIADSKPCPCRGGEKGEASDG